MFELLQYLGELDCEHVVIFNDEKLVEEISEMNPKGIVISPGPGELATCFQHCRIFPVAECL